MHIIGQVLENLNILYWESIKYKDADPNAFKCPTAFRFTH